MTEPKNSQLAPHQRWFAEMKRRKVFRVIAVYGAVSFVVIQFADLIFPLVQLPEWAVRLVLWLAILGFPIAVVLAWAFETTPDGVRRTEPASPGEIDAIVAAPVLARWSPGLLALGGIALLAVGFYGGSRSSMDTLDQASVPTAEVRAGAGLAYVDPADDPRPAIAVLPFEDMSPEGDQEYFSDGISLEITAVLSRIRGLRTAARQSAFTCKGRNLDLRQVGDELDVAYLLSGSVRKEGDQLRIDAELVSSSDGLSLWSQTYNRRLQDVFAIQTEIAEAIAEELRVPLGLGRDELVHSTLDMDAYDLYLSGRAALRRRGPGIGESVVLFEAATGRDSMWAPAWAGLAEAHALTPLYTGLGGESFDAEVWARSLAAAEHAARRALEFDPRSASARVGLGSAHRDQWEWQDSEREYLRALELDPDSEEAHTQYAELLYGMGRMDEALRETGRALALDRAPVRLDLHAFVLIMNSRPGEAEPLLEEGLAIDTAGEVHYLRSVLAEPMLFDGRYLEALDRFGAYVPDGYRQMGEALEAGDVGLLPASAGRGFAQTLVLLGEHERALDILEELVFSMPFRVRYEIWDPLLAPIWDSARFQTVILPRLRLEGVEPSITTSPGRR